MENKVAGGYCLAAIRIMIGWMMIWPFFDKLFGLGFQTGRGQGWVDGTSPSSFVNYVSGGFFGDFFNAIGGTLVVDILMMLALLVFGITLMLGFASKITTIGMTAFLLTMYLLHVPPTDNPLIDYHIVWIASLLAVYYLGGYDILSINEKWKGSWLAKRFPILA